jgi:serine/threonine protein kinase
MPDQPTNDEIADQYDQAWQEGRPTLQQFLQRQHEREQAALLKLLLPIDIEYRKRAGENVDAEDYLDVSTDAVEVARRVMEQVAIDLTREPGSSEPPVDHGATFDPPPNRVSFSQSRQIGPYKLLQKIGEGGMGSVWMAEQEKPVRRRVAVKLIKAGIDNRQVLARFEAERQALAMMNHENIARILDAGTTDSGQPYFVMELVQGIPFNKYCDENQMSVDDRLKLFIPVCKAIQHAHQKGIIHRDLKPSNVLVCLYDGVPVPKVIDFGLEKALQHQTKLTDKTMFTEYGKVVGTLQYMAPEQAGMDGQPKRPYQSA